MSRTKLGEKAFLKYTRFMILENFPEIQNLSPSLGLSLRPLSICDKDPRRSDVNCLVKRPRIETGGVPLCYTKRVLKTKVDDHNHASDPQFRFFPKISLNA